MQNRNYANFSDEKTEEDVIAVGVPINLPQGQATGNYFQQPLNPYSANLQQGQIPNHNGMHNPMMNQPRTVQINPPMAPMIQQYIIFNIDK